MDLFGDLPPAAGEKAEASTKASHKKNAATFLKPRSTSSIVLPPQRLAARPTQLMAPPQTRPRTAVTHEPIEIHGHSRNSATSKGDTVIHVDCADLQELAFKGEAYDPARPNDYMEFCKERENRAKDEERQREYEKFRKEREEEMRRGRNTLAGLQSLPSNGDNPMPDSIMPARGRGRGGVSNLPSWMTKGAPVEDKNRCVDTLSALESGKTQFADAQDAIATGGGVEPRGRTEGIGAALMKKLGYQEGAGLGRDRQGITEAIKARALGGGKGVIGGPAQGGKGAQDVDRQQQQPQPKKKKRGLFSNPTKIVLLKNMVGPGEVDDDLQGETAEECAKHGPVSECLVFEVKRVKYSGKKTHVFVGQICTWPDTFALQLYSDMYDLLTQILSQQVARIVNDNSYPEEERVRTFVAFERQESAVKAYVAMNGRFFGGRQVQASFFDEEKFARKDLAPGKEEC